MTALLGAFEPGLTKGSSGERFNRELESGAALAGPVSIGGRGAGARGAVPENPAPALPVSACPAAELGLQVLERRVQVADRVVAALRIARIRERMRRQPPEPALVDDDVHIFDEIRRRRAAVAARPVQLARLRPDP